MSKKTILKAYTQRFGLIKSKPMRNEKHIESALFELSQCTEITAVFLTDGTKSQKLNIAFKDQKTRPIFYTRSDGKKTFGLSIHPKNYPMTAHFANGKTEKIELKN